MRLDLLGLQAFLSIAERGSFHAAAAHLNLTQTALSHRLRKLEDLLGVRLLARTTRQVSLTPAGLELLPKARRLIDDMGAAFEALARQARQGQERLAIGCLPTIAMACLPKALARFRLDYPETCVRVFDNSASEVAECVERGDAAFGVTILAANRWDLDSEPLAREPFVLVLGRDHPLAGRGALAWDDLAGLSLVRIGAETGNRILIDDALGERREKLAWTYEVQRVYTAISLVRGGLVGAIVPQLAYDFAADRRLVALRLSAPSVSRTVSVVKRRGLPLEPMAALLLKRIGEALAETIVPDGQQGDP